MEPKKKSFYLLNEHEPFQANFSKFNLKATDYDGREEGHGDPCHQSEEESPKKHLDITKNKDMLQTNRWGDVHGRKGG